MPCITHGHAPSGQLYSLRCRNFASRTGRKSHARGGRQCASKDMGQKLWTPREDRKAVLVADIGGTNCRFELCELLDGQLPQTLISETFQTKDYQSFEDALDAFAKLPNFEENSPSAAAFAVAGPVSKNKCVMTNLDWTIDGPKLSQAYGIRVAVLNDFEANGYGIPTLTSADIIPIHDVPAEPQAPVVVMGPGTGLGQAYLTWNEAIDAYKVWPSEGSHATYGPKGSKQRALQEFVEKRLGQCETEYIACGSGLEMIYDFLYAKGQAEGSQKRVKDAPSITKGAVEGIDELACETVDLFLQVLGNEASGNALRYMSRGGVYLCGGILPRVKDRVLSGGMLEAYLNKNGRFAGVLKQIPLYLVMDTNLGVRGTVSYAAQLSKLSAASEAFDRS